MIAQVGIAAAGFGALSKKSNQALTRLKRAMPILSGLDKGDASPAHVIPMTCHEILNCGPNSQGANTALIVFMDSKSLKGSLGYYTMPRISGVARSELTGTLLCFPFSSLRPNPRRALMVSPITRFRLPSLFESSCLYNTN
ncbi:hypothetical protein LB505_011041 [Fusarium chuoi]|nr:hypothetical protein LB505_011041 [Fusarium chuoi]